MRAGFRFGLRTLLIAMTVFAVAIGLYAKKLRDRRAAVISIEELGGALGVQYNAPKWFRDLFDDQRYFWDPAGVHFNTDHFVTEEELRSVVGTLRGFQRLRDLTLHGSAVSDQGIAELQGLELQFLDLSQTNVTDESVPILKGMNTLNHLLISQTAISDEGARALQEALPGCKIER